MELENILNFIATSELEWEALRSNSHRCRFNNGGIIVSHWDKTLEVTWRTRPATRKTFELNDEEYEIVCKSIW